MMTFSQSYAAILDLLFKTETIKNDMYSVDWDNGQFSKVKIDGKTRRPAQEITITDSDMIKDCTLQELYIISLLMWQLKPYNALWLCPADVKKNSSNRVAIKKLIEKNVLIKTETPHIYIVNPLYIRKGEFYSILVTTAKMLMNIPKVLPEHITTKKPVAQLDIPRDHIPSQPNLGYGYADLGE